MASPAAALGSHVWLGAETGLLKGVNLQKKKATNYKLGDASVSRHEAVTAMCWGDLYESEILVGCLDGSVRLFSIEKGRFIETQNCQGGEGAFCGLCVLDSSLVTCVESGLLKVWRDVSSENVEIQVGSGVCRMRQNPEHPHHVATGGKENCLKVWDLCQPQEPIFKAKNVRNDWLDLRVPVWEKDMQFLPGSEKIVTCTGHHQVRLYDPSCPQRRPVLEATFGEYPLTALSLTPDANSAVVGSSRGDVAVIDLRQGRLLKCLKGFAGSVRAIQCHPVLPLVASCGLDRFLRVHNLHHKRLEHKVYLKSRLNCLLLNSREKWEDEALDPSADLESDVKEEEDEVDEIWNSMEVVVAKRKAEPQPSSDMECGQHQKSKAPKKQKKIKKVDS
ncbi:WD repeat-containing protein 74 isoform X2 [Sceloporus undulatus]|uniref:WD repeat-containing protein 74 isoform X2 n=1 Tax=Sceloporus undulatus TaxID=8520 RepID=UPI001C4AADCC|nr:WD repeat-containing protein 74 isoform X2 [Sceloporus undulatus]